MKIAFYCRVDGQGFGFVLPDEADKLREFFAEHQDMLWNFNGAYYLSSRYTTTNDDMDSFLANAEDTAETVSYTHLAATPMWTVGISSMPRSALLRWSIRSGLPFLSKKSLV